MRNNIISTLVVIAVVFVIGLILYPVFAQPRSNPHHRPQIYKLKQLGTAFIIYTADNDDRLPNAIEMPVLKEQLMPYTKNESLFEGVEDYFEAPQYNYNVAGIKTTDLQPLGYKTPIPLDKITLMYAVATAKVNKGKAYQVRADGSVKLVPMSELIDSLNYQFDRSGITLATSENYVPESKPTEEDK